MDEEFFRDRLRFFRNQKRISAREMSLALGQNETFINKIETGKSSTTISSFFNICDYLQISPLEFFNAEIKSSVENTKEMTRLFRCLSPRQSKYVLELLHDLVDGGERL